MGPRLEFLPLKPLLLSEALTIFCSPGSFLGMEPLHAPWRIAYILGPKPVPASAGVFNEIAQSNDDVGNYVVVRERSCFAVLNRYPYTGGHLLVVPYKRTADLNGLTEQE